MGMQELQGLSFPLTESEVLQALRKVQKFDAPAILAGSWVDGRGHPGADVDVYAFPAESPLEQPKVCSTQIRDTEVDVEIWPQAIVHRTIEKFSADRAWSAPDLPPATFRERLLLESIHIGIPLLDASYVEALKVRLAERKSRRYIRGLLDGQHEIAALMELGTAAQVVADAFLVAHGSYNPHRRWLHERFRHTGPGGESFRKDFLLHRFPQVHLADARAVRNRVEEGVDWIEASYLELLPRFAPWIMNHPEDRPAGARGVEVG